MADPGDRLRGRRRQKKKIIAHRDRAQRRRRFAIMLFPPRAKERRPHGHGGQKQPERQNHPRIGFVSHASKLGASLPPSNTFAASSVKTPIISGFSGSGVVSTPPAGVPPTESFVRNWPACWVSPQAHR